MNDSFTNAKWLFVHSNTLKTYEQYVRVKHGNIVLYCNTLNISSQFRYQNNESDLCKMISLMTLFQMAPVSVTPSTETLICHSRANPAVENYTWFKIYNDHISAAGHQRELHLKKDFQGDHNYFCMATNKYGSHNSSTVLLRGKGKQIYVPNTVACADTTLQRGVCPWKPFQTNRTCLVFFYFNVQHPCFLSVLVDRHQRSDCYLYFYCCTPHRGHCCCHQKVKCIYICYSSHMQQ